MREKDDILNLLKEKGAEAARETLRGMILQPGAIGDCILTLPLAEAMKDYLGLGGIDIFGHTEYIGYFPGRTCIDGVHCIDSAELHRLFANSDTFDLTDKDPLINTFSNYSWIATFMGEPDSNFEQNLIFTVNCSHSAEVITLPLTPNQETSEHITDFYIQQFTTQSGLITEPRAIQKNKSLIKATQADINRGKELLKEIGIGSSEPLAIIQPGSGGLHKCCHIDNFLAVAAELVSNDINVIFLLGPAESERYSNEAIQKMSAVARCITDLSLTEVLELLSGSDIFIGNDCGITHLAAAMGVKTIAVFGPTDPDIYRPIGPAVKVITYNDTDFTKKPSTSIQNQLLGAV